VNPVLAPLPDLKISESELQLRSFIPRDQIHPPLRLDCQLPVSKGNVGLVASESGTVMVDYRKGTYEVDNAWLVKVNRRVREGDSGGLLYLREAGVGMIFASSGSDDGWAWFHPLADAFNYINEKIPNPVQCFAS
jgi:hypothetical protein